MEIQRAHGLAAAVACLTLALPAGAQVEIIDPALLTQQVVPAQCDLSTPPTANECLSRVVPSLNWRASNHLAHMATYMIKVKLKKLPDGSPANGEPSVGTAFLVDAKRGYFLTAKHVILGSAVWSTRFPPDHLFSDLETAIEDHLYRDENAEIMLHPDEDLPGISAFLIALDRNSDLALIAANNVRAITLIDYPALYRSISFAPTIDCATLKVTAVGFAESPRPGKRERRGTNFGDGSCETYPKTYFIGGKKYRVPLYRTNSAFEPGYSGGPVLDRNLQLVGVVSGATLQPGARQHFFFVPLPAVRSFLARFQ